MLPKIKLLQSDNYAVIWATNKIALIISQYMRGHDHVLEIGSEQGDINVWDDFVLRTNGDLYKHVQIKRQATDFDPTGFCIRGVYSHKERDGELRDMTALDETFLALSKFYDNPANQSKISYKKFILVLPDGGIKIKKDLNVREFRNLCNNIVKPNTTADGMIELQDKDPITLKVFNWLHSWASFKDWEQILIALKNLEILNVGDECDLQTSTKESLEPYFNNLESVIPIIEKVIREGATLPNTLSPRYLVGLLSSHLKEDLEKWTQYSKSTSLWSKGGIHDTQNIETPSILVRELWNEKISSALKFGNPNGEIKLCPISNALLRLGIHFTGASRFQVENPDGWKALCKSEVGGTLGLEERDCDIITFLNYKPFEISSEGNLNTLLEQEEEARILHTEMDNFTKDKVFNLVNEKIKSVQSQEIRLATANRWNVWESDFEAGNNNLGELFKDMMLPLIEGEAIDVNFRVGPRTAFLLAEGIFFLLIVSIGYDPNNNSWELVEKNKISSKALRWWSGPSYKKKTVRAIADSDLIEMIKFEKADCVVLSGTDNSLSDIYQTSLAESYSDASNMTELISSKVVLTMSTRLKREIRTGSIKSLHELITKEINSYAKNIDELIKTI